MPFQVAKNDSDYDYGKMYQLLLQISCYSERILSQDLMVMQQKLQGLILKYLHFLVNNARLVEKVGNSHLGFMYHLIENKLHLLTFEDFFHATYCQVTRAQDDNDVDDSEKAKKSGGDEAAAGTDNGSESGFDEVGNE